MSPYEIKLLLDLYCIQDWYEKRDEPIFPETIASFESLGLVVTVLGSLKSAKLTSKGRAHVSQLCNLPFPQEVKHWSDYTGNVIPNI